MSLSSNATLRSDAKSVGAHERSHSVGKKLCVIKRIAWHHSLVQVRIESHLLHVLIRTHFDESFTSRIRAVKHLLKDVKHLVRGPVLAVPFVEIDSEVRFINFLHLVT